MPSAAPIQLCSHSLPTLAGGRRPASPRSNLDSQDYSRHGELLPWLTAESWGITYQQNTVSEAHFCTTNPERIVVSTEDAEDSVHQANEAFLRGLATQFLEIRRKIVASQPVIDCRVLPS